MPTIEQLNNIVYIYNIVIYQLLYKQLYIEVSLPSLLLGHIVTKGQFELIEQAFFLIIMVVKNIPMCSLLFLWGI